MKTNLKYALRNIKNNTTNSVISVVGLTIAIACCLWIYFFVSQENSYNSFLDNAESIFRVNYTIKYVDGSNSDVRVEPELADILAQNVPQIESSSEFRSAFNQLLKHSNEYYDVDMSYADREFFEIFNLQFLAGDKESVFRGPEEIVITQDLADKLVGKENKDYSLLIGQSIEFPLAYSNRQFRITGIIENQAKNSSFRPYEGIIPGENGRNFGGCDNSIGYTSVFYKVKDGSDLKNAKQNTIAQMHKYYDNRVQRMINNNEVLDVPDAFTPFSLSMNEVYFEDEISSCNVITGSRRTSTILISIGILILLIACSNYTILSLGQALKKMGEVGVRKAMGARTGNIFSIFFSEGLLLAIIAFSVGTLLCLFFLQNVNRIAEIEIFTELINISGLIIFIILSFITVVVFTSAIPVLVFSRMNPNQLVGKKLTAGKKGLLTQLFVSFQYSLSIILIIVTISIVRQSNYLKNKSLGLTSENILDVGIDNMENDQKLLFRSLLEEHPGVTNQTLCARNFMNGSSSTYVDKGNGEQISVYRFKVDEKYIPTIDLQLIHGKNFSFSNIQSDDRTMIVNSRFVETFGIADNPIGQSYEFGSTNFTIIGVVEDYHFRNSSEELRPAMLFTRQNWGNGYYRALVRFNPDQLTDVMAHVKECYQKLAPGTNLEYTFWDEELGKRYEEEERWSKIIGFASVIAILISSLGLFGLTILLINKRIKEIGVRKVNGARLADVLITINRSFASCLLTSIAIATPIGYYITKLWLKDYACRAEISWWVFILAGSLTIGIALITVSWQSWKAARRNPIEALRYE